jgi:hypothetical protein
MKKSIDTSWDGTSDLPTSASVGVEYDRSSVRKVPGVYKVYCIQIIEKVQSACSTTTTTTTSISSSSSSYSSNNTHKMFMLVQNK